MTKYGIKFKPTNEWITWYNTDEDKTVLFDSDLAKVKMMTLDVLLSDGGYDGEKEDIGVEEVDVPDDYIGPDNIEDITFISDDVVKQNV